MHDDLYYKTLYEAEQDYEACDDINRMFFDDEIEMDFDDYIEYGATSDFVVRGEDGIWRAPMENKHMQKAENSTLNYSYFEDVFDEDLS